MRKLQRDIERFFYRNRSKGIPHLMLFVALGNLLVYILMNIDPSNAIYYILHFDRAAILRGQVWRLFSYVFIPGLGASFNAFSIFFMFLMYYFYYRIGNLLEGRWGILKFNCYYFLGILLTDIAALAFNTYADISYLNLSLLLAFATICPEDRLLLMYIIPIKMKYLACVYFLSIIITFFSEPFPYSILPIISLLNYFLFFGSEVKNILPSFGRYHHKRANEERRRTNPHAAPDPKWADNYKSKSGSTPYRHKCTVCGRTDVDSPGLEFRYCSQCNGYHCYCMDHINDHAHFQ